MRYKHSIVFGLLITLMFACSRNNDRFERDIQIPDFNFPSAVIFESNLSTYNIFDGQSADLIPTEDFELLELSSILFTDHAQKQRLIKLPEGEKITLSNDGKLIFPDGTVLTKTFYYFNDEGDPNAGKRIIETRLLIKENEIWNAATYLWNEEQTEATLEVNGHDTQISWIDSEGTTQSTLYHVPNENECIACHQSNEAMTPLGPSLLNLNRKVNRNGNEINQLVHLQSINLIGSIDVNQITTMVDYNDLSKSIEDRGRAYLAMNCAHCHNPDSWERTQDREFDFRYNISLDETGIRYEEEKILEALIDGEMPLIGTTLIDKEGLRLITEFLESL